MMTTLEAFYCGQLQARGQFGHEPYTVCMLCTSPIPSGMCTSNKADLQAGRHKGFESPSVMQPARLEAPTAATLHPIDCVRTTIYCTRYAILWKDICVLIPFPVLSSLCLGPRTSHLQLWSSRSTYQVPLSRAAVPRSSKPSWVPVALAWAGTRP